MQGFWSDLRETPTKGTGLPLRAYLRRLIWICMLPLVLLAIYLGIDSVRKVRAADDRASARLANAIASAVDQTLQARIDALTALSLSPLLDDVQRLADFYREAQSIRRIFGGEVILADLSGHMLIHTGYPFNSVLPALPRPTGTAAVSRALASGRAAVGDSFMGPLAKTLLVAIAVPVGQGGKSELLLLTIIDMQHLQGIIDQMSIPLGWSASILDGKNEVLAAHLAPGSGRQGGPDSGVRLIVGSKVSGWSVVLVSSAQSRLAPVLSAAQALVVAILGATLIGLLAGTLAGRRLARSVASLANDATASAHEIAEIGAVRRRLEESTQQREAASAAMRESEAESRGMFETMSDALIFADSQRRIRRVNPAFVTTFGYSAEEVIGRTTEFLYADPSDYAIQGRLRFQSRPASTDTPYELRYRRKDGIELWTESIGRGIVGPDGTVVGGFAMHRDVTAQKQGERTRLKLEAQLLQAQKMEALGTLAGGIAHDFNNILTAISGNVELARLDAGADSPLQRNLAETAKAAQRAADLVRQILTFSRRQPLERVVVNLRELALEAVKLLRSTLPARIELVTTLASDSPNVLADRTQLHQVLMNLVVNAAQAIGREPGRIEISLAGTIVSGDATVTTLAPGRYARLTVTDNGPGMDASTRQRIFDPFFTTKPIGEGTGLGLAVVDGIVKRLSGAITVYSEPGRGCVFHLYFPATASDVVTAVEPSTFGLLAGSNQRVLYLDDDEALVMIGKAMLERLGYRVDGYTDAGQALAAFKAEPQEFDALVSDFNMPGTSGLEIAEKMLRLRPDLPVALASGLVTDDLLTRAHVLGVREVIYKPHSMGDLASALHRMFEGNV
jgi:two-component system, cell cycle sensor histidine kinase and response regulator CckA